MLTLIENSITFNKLVSNIFSAILKIYHLHSHKLSRVKDSEK